jgi:hypothetical protein
MKRSIAPALIAFALCAVTGTALAADFTFNVPLNLQNVHPDVRTATVFCRVFKVRGGYAAENIIAKSDRADIRIPIDSDGNYRGTLSVSAETESGKNPADGRYYECDLAFNSFTLQSDSRARGAPYESRTGTTRTVRVHGDIPR